MSRVARLGAFVFGAILVLAVSIFLIGRKEFLFSRTLRLYAPFDNVAGLNNGAEVRAGGVHIGAVNHIQMPSKPGEKVRVVMNLKKSAGNVIRKDSVASILTEGLLGDKYVSISFGSDKTPPVKDGDTIGSRPPIEFS